MEVAGRCPLAGRSAPLYSPLVSFLQRCFQTTNGYLSDSRSCSSNYNVAALATSSLVGRLQRPCPALGFARPSPHPLLRAGQTELQLEGVQPVGANISWIHAPRRVLQG